ncbi:MAG: alpha/beta hydrolase [Armatimonadetes bacterium]|nr:alpha/beta hydrolase [Armatimonadota bacterium]
MPTIDIDGMRVAYEEAGTGLPIVFIPGLVGTKEWFQYQFTGLGGSYRVISYELRPAQNAAAHNVDVLAEDLARLLSALKIDSAVIAGHSFGAMVAQRFAALHRPRTRALVLMSAFPRLPDVPAHILLEWLCPGPVELETPFRSLLSRLFRFKPPPVPEDVDGSEWLAARSAKLAQGTLDTRIRLVQQFDSVLWLSRIEAPTLILVGAKDCAPLQSCAQELYDLIQDTALEVIEDCEHFCFYSRHDVVNDAIDDFLTERLRSL